MPVPGQSSIPESAKGFEGALQKDRCGWTGCTLLVVPAVVDISPDTMETIARFLRTGTTVVIESGAAFAGHLNFRQHRRSLREYLQIDVNAPIDLWAHKSQRAPYIDLTWPHTAKIRDFSRVVPIGDQTTDGEVIAWADGWPIGIKRSLDRGTLIYLGSPLGPALHAGDTEAHQWLSRLFSL